MNQCEMDERQLSIRGQAFKHGLLLMGGLILLDAFLKSDVITQEGIVLVEGMWGNILIVVLTITLCMVEIIVKDAMDLENKRNRLLILFFALIGGILFLWGIMNQVVDQDPFFVNHSLSQHGAEFIMDICYFMIGIIGLTKMRRLKYED